MRAAVALLAGVVVAGLVPSAALAGPSGARPPAATAAAQAYRDDRVVRGRVVDGTGRVVPGATVVLHFPAWLEGYTEHRTADEDGRFRFRRLEDGHHAVCARAPGFATSCVRVRLSGPRPLTRVKVRIKRFGRVTGRVADRSGTPLEGVRVLYYEPFARAGPATT